MLIFTLTSIPPRFSRIGPTLGSLKAQTARPDAIHLYIPASYQRFPDWNGNLPKVPEGVEIHRVADDFGPATKVLPAARAFRGRDVDILFCDDDRAYAPGWAAEFLRAKRAHPGCAIAKRGMMAHDKVGTTTRRKLQPRALHRPEWADPGFLIRRLVAGRNSAGQPERKLFSRSGYTDMFEGCAGVLVQPDYFDDRAFDIPQVARTVDDVWLSGMLAHKGIPIWLVANTLTPAKTGADGQAPLAQMQTGGDGRHEANIAAIRHMQEEFGVWLG